MWYVLFILDRSNYYLYLHHHATINKIQYLVNMIIFSLLFWICLGEVNIYYSFFIPLELYVWLGVIQFVACYMKGEQNYYLPLNMVIENMYILNFEETKSSL